VATQHVSVVIADAHPLFRLGMRLFLSSQPGFELVSEAENLQQLLRHLSQRRPDVVIVELALVISDHIDESPFLQQHLHRDRLLVMTDDLAHPLIDHGLVMLCSKRAEPDLVLRALKTLALRPRETEHGERVTPSKWLSTLSTSINPLTGRELDIIKLIALGMSNHQISLELGISDQTVKNHVTAILRKLEVSDRAQAVLISLHSGWISLEESE
jgi:DNA-binding NarL/FixJ family response regulator